MFIVERVLIPDSPITFTFCVYFTKIF